jgi:hypothetical protein
MNPPTITPVKHIRISDPHVIAIVESIRHKTGEATANKTAGRLIIERVTLMQADERTARTEQQVA